MSSNEVRKSIIEAAKHSGMLSNVSKSDVDGFLRGTKDIRLTAIDTESLAVLEFCILLEENYGLSITPRDLFTYETLADVATFLGNDDEH